MDASRRTLILGTCAALLPQPLWARRLRFLRMGIEAVLVGAVSGYVAARVAEQNSTQVLVSRGWHKGDMLYAPRSFEAIEYPTERLVTVPAGSYEVISTTPVMVPRLGQANVLVVKNHLSKTYVGVAYA